MAANAADRAIKYFLLLGFIVVAAAGVGLYWKGRPAQQKVEAEQKANETLLQTVLQSAPVSGDNNAKVLLVEFGDFQCPFCKQASGAVNSFMAKHALEVKRVWIQAYNTDAHPEAERAAIASQCANKQGLFWQYHDYLYDQQDNLSPLLYNQIAQTLHLNMANFTACLGDTATRDLVRAHRQFAERQDIKEVPYILINNQALSGQIDEPSLEQALKTALAS